MKHKTLTGSIPSGRIMRCGPLTFRYFGTIPAGSLQDALPEESRTVSAIADLVDLAPDEVILRVPEDGMMEAGIRQGDHVIVTPVVQDWQPKDILAVSCAGLGFLLAYVEIASQALLTFAHPDAEQVSCPLDALYILGKVTGVLQTRLFQT